MSTRWIQSRGTRAWLVAALVAAAGLVMIGAAAGAGGEPKGAPSGDETGGSRPDTPKLGEITDYLTGRFGSSKGLQPEIQVALRLKEKELEKERDRIEVERSRVQAMRARVEARFREMEVLRELLDRRMKEFQDERTKAKDERIAKLQKVIAGMSPEAAAAMLQKMDRELVVGLLYKMNGRKLARIMDALPPDQAALLTSGFAKLTLGGER